MKIYSKLLQTSFVSGVSTVIKILTGMITLKIIALYTGPEGVAILGQFMGLANIFTTIAGGGIALGVIKYVAEYSSNPNEFKTFLSTAMFYTLFFSIVTMIVGLAYSQVIAKWVLGSEEFSYLICWMAISQLFIALHLLLCSIINGFGEIRLLASITITSSLLSLILMSVVAIFYQLNGILLSFILVQALAILVSCAFVYRKKWFSFLLVMRVRSTHIINLLRYSFMTTVSTLTVPLSQIIVRDDLSILFGWEAVGYWQAVLRLSDAYLLFVTTALTAYYLPRLSELISSSELKQEIAYAYRVLMPVLGLILMVIYLFRHLIITLLYSKTFAPATDLFFFQLLGDFFRVAGWLYTYLLLAKTRTKTYVLTEITLSVVFIFLSYPFSRSYGIEGVTYAFALTYLIYWLLMGLIIIFYFKEKDKNLKAILS